MSPLRQCSVRSRSCSSLSAETPRCGLGLHVPEAKDAVLLFMGLLAVCISSVKGLRISCPCPSWIVWGFGAEFESPLSSLHAVLCRVCGLLACSPGLSFSLLTRPSSEHTHSISMALAYQGFSLWIVVF